MQSLLLTALLALPSVITANAVCSHGLYGALLPLANYPPAENFCSLHFPPLEATVTITAGSARHRRRRTPAKVDANTRDELPQLWSNLVKEADNILQTFCSCIETPRTTTVCFSNISKEIGHQR